MARKTCIRRLAKSLPLESEKFARALEMSDARDEGDADIEIPADVVAVEEPANPNEATKQTLRAKAAASKPQPPKTEQLTEAKRLHALLSEHNPTLAAQLWEEHSQPYTEQQYQALINTLTAEVRSAEGAS
jgi:sugar diacid utilization regulator